MRLWFAGIAIICRIESGFHLEHARWFGNQPGVLPKQVRRAFTAPMLNQRILEGRAGCFDFRIQLVVVAQVKRQEEEVFDSQVAPRLQNRQIMPVHGSVFLTIFGAWKRLLT